MCCYILLAKERQIFKEIMMSRSVGKESTCNAGDPSSIPGSGRSAGEGIGYPLQYSWASLLLSWQRIHPQCRRPGFNPWVGKILWRRGSLPTPVFWPWRISRVPWGHKESDMTERLSLVLSIVNKMKGQIPAHSHHCLSVIQDNGRASVWKPKGEEINSDW